MTVATAPSIPRVAWDEHRAALDWRQGEHVSLIGPTGRGKTTLLKHLLTVREDAGGHVCVVATKPRDPSLGALQRRGYRRIPSMAMHHVGTRLVLLWPKMRTMDDRGGQAIEIQHALWTMFAQGAWCVAVDELHYVTSELHLEDEVTTLLTQGRSVGISVVSGAQRPRWVPLAALNQATHLYLWQTGDHYDLRRLSELGGADVTAIRDVLPTLERFDVLYVNTRDGHLAVTRPPK